MIKNTFSNVIPMTTQVLQNFESGDIRFTKVKIWLMHLGLNRNGSVFNKEAVEAAIPSLANTPIIASVRQFGDEKDFEGHETEVEITENGDVKVVNATIPYGVIPEFNNAKFEKRVGDDMIEREYLTCEGLIWNKWTDARDIISGKGGLTGQSMELAPDFKGVFNGKHFEFTDFKFDGACLLGDDILPAMHNSTVEIKYAASTNKYIEEKVKQFSKIHFTNQEGGNTVQEEKLNNFDSEHEEAEEVVEKQELETDEHTVTHPEPKVKLQEEETASHDEDSRLEEEEEEEADLTDDEDETEAEIKGAPAKAVERILVDKQDLDEVAEIRQKAQKEEAALPKPSDMIIVAGRQYSVKDLESIIKKYAEVSQEFEALKQEVHSEKTQALLEKYSSEISNADIAELTQSAHQFSLADIENRIFMIIGKNKIKNSSNTTESNVTFSEIKVPTNQKKTSTLEEIIESLKK